MQHASKIHKYTPNYAPLVGYSKTIKNWEIILSDTRYFPNTAKYLLFYEIKQQTRFVSVVMYKRLILFPSSAASLFQ